MNTIEHILFEHEGIHLEYDKILKNKHSYIDDPDVTGPEKPRQTGNDIVMVMVVEQNQLFAMDVSIGGDAERP